MPRAVCFLVIASGAARAFLPRAGRAGVAPPTARRQRSAAPLAVVEVSRGGSTGNGLRPAPVWGVRGRVQ